MRRDRLFSCYKKWREASQLALGTLCTALASIVSLLSTFTHRSVGPSAIGLPIWLHSQNPNAPLVLLNPDNPFMVRLSRSPHHLYKYAQLQFCSNLTHRTALKAATPRREPCESRH